MQFLAQFSVESILIHGGDTKIKVKIKKTVIVFFLLAALFAMILLMINYKNKYNSSFSKKDQMIQEIKLEEENSNISKKQEFGIIARVSIPKLNLYNLPVKEGVDSQVLESSIGHFPHTSLSSGNIGIAAHNDGTKEANFFKHLHEVVLQDKIYINIKDEEKEYEVNLIKVIDETDWSYLEDSYKNTLTLITCVSGKENKRLCVQAIKI